MLFWMRLRDWLRLSYVILNTNRSHFGEIIFSPVSQETSHLLWKHSRGLFLSYLFKLPPIYCRFFLYFDFKGQNVILKCIYTHTHARARAHAHTHMHAHTHTHTQNSFEVLDKDSFNFFNAN